MEENNQLTPQEGQVNEQLEPATEPEVVETWDESNSPEGQEWDNQEPEASNNDEWEVINWEDKYNSSNKSYSELRSKFDSNNNEHKSKMEEAQWELWAYQQYYNDNNKMLEVLNWNPELLEQVNWLIKDEVMTKEQVLQLMSQEADKRNASQTEEAEYDKALLDWWESRTDVSETVMNKVLESLNDKDYEWKSIQDTIKMLNWQVAIETLKHNKSVNKEKDKLRTEQLDWVRWNVTPWAVSSNIKTTKTDKPFIKRRTSWFSPF